MAVRLAVIGAVLTVGGLVNIGGYGKIAVPLGLAVLLVGGILIARGRNSPKRR